MVTSPFSILNNNNNNILYLHDYNYLQYCKRYVKKERKEKEIKIIMILITDNQVTLFLHDSTLSRRLFNNETRLHILPCSTIPKKTENKTLNH